MYSWPVNGRVRAAELDSTVWVGSLGMAGLFLCSLLVVSPHDITRSGTCGLQKSGYGEQIWYFTKNTGAANPNRSP